MLLKSCILGLFGLTCVEAVRYGVNHAPVRRDNELVAANFRDVQGYELLSPAFLNQDTVSTDFANGTAGPTSDAELEYFLRNLASKNTWMTYNVARYQSEEGRSFSYLFLSSSTQSSPANDTNKLRVWIQAAVHGNEPASDQSILALVGKMDANQTWTQSVLDKMDIMILPRYNPDGVAYFQRALATNLDPNRDHVKLARQHTRDIKTTFGEFSPHIAIDMHEFSAPSVYGGSFVHASDALFSAAKNLNINPGIRRMSEDLFAENMGNALEAAGLRWAPYVTGASSTRPGSSIRFSEAGSDGKIGRNAMGLTQTVTFLCETRGIGLADQHFQRRTVASLVMAEAIIQTAVDNAEKVYQTITNGIEDFMNSDADVVITDSPTYMNRTFPMIDRTNGTLLDASVEFVSTTPTAANLTRSRPEAYIIPSAWKDLVIRLEAYGLEATTTTQSFRGKVQALNITSVAFGKTYYEGTVPVTVTTSLMEKEIELPAGSFVVSTRQRNAGLALVALEPENIDSYVAFNIIPVEVGDEYPVYRLMA